MTKSRRYITILCIIGMVLMIVVGVPSHSHDVCTDVDTTSCEVYDTTKEKKVLDTKIKTVHAMEMVTEIQEVKPPKISPIEKEIRDHITEIVLSILVLLAGIAVLLAFLLEYTKRKRNR